jgi:hypothetical protein
MDVDAIEDATGDDRERRHERDAASETRSSGRLHPRHRPARPPAPDRSAESRRACGARRPSSPSVAATGGALT